VEKKWEGFLTLIAQILELCHQMLALGKTKREILVSGKTEGLEKIIKQEELLLMQIDKLETERSKKSREITEIHGIQLAEMTLSDIAKLAEASVAGQIQEIGAHLKKTVGELGELNQLNNKLLQQALFFVNCNINLLVQNQAEPVYGVQNSSNTTNTMRGRLLVDQKI
jgi:flagellar biosynthesis/type III secretory pathway chaperone